MRASFALALVFGVFGVVTASCAEPPAVPDYEGPSNADSPSRDRPRGATSPREPAGSAPGDAPAPARDAACVARPEAPRAIEGTSPLDPGFLDAKGRPVRFECFGACGASCDLQHKREDALSVCQSSQCGTHEHRTLTYRRVEGATHPFCSWHDSCYAGCSKAFEIDSPDDYSTCSRWCDFGCVSPNNWNRSLVAGTYDPDFFSRSLAGGVVFQATGSDSDRERWIAATAPAGFIPSRTWSDEDCAAWSTTGLLGANFLADMASSAGTIVFTELQQATDWEPGDCP